MKQRVRSVWLPGLITGALAWGVFWLLETFGVRPRVFWWNHDVMMFSLVWTLTLPIIGAVGAHTSRQGGGHRSELILVGLFPSLVLAILFCTGLTLRGILAESSIPLSTVAVGLLCWVIVPAVALLLALTLGHRVPDCLYLAVAEREGAALVTADRRLDELARRRGVASELVPSA